MTLGIVGRKLGMTRIFKEDGRSVPVTVIEAIPNRVIRSVYDEKNGYRAIQVAWGSRKTAKVNRAICGIHAKAGVDMGEGLLEFRVADGQELSAGSEIKVDLFEAGQKVDVCGTSIGKGFSGVIKRHNFSHQRNSHGNSVSHRAPGSIGQCQTPGRVFKGKKMCGHMGNAKVTLQNLEIIKVDSARNLLLVHGSIPGAKGGRIVIKGSVKAGID